MRTTSTTDIRMRRAGRGAPAIPVRAGLTLVEILVAMTVTSVLIAATVPFFVAQARSVSQTAARTDAHHNARYAVNTIDRDLRVAGVGVVDAQPMIVYADSNVITINGDLVSLVRDASAVYSDPDAPLNVVTSLGKPNKISLPQASSLMYPDTTYWLSPGVPSAAETVSYWLERDSSVTATTQYILWRRVNDTAPRVVAKNLILQAGQPAFRYFKSDSVGRLVEIPKTSLPFFHSAPIHSQITGARPDTGKSAQTDSIRAISVRIVSRYFDKRRSREILDTADAFIRIPNAGLHRVATCGERPLFGSAISNGVVTDPVTGQHTVQLSWSPATDETGGELDVERYAVYRRPVSELLFSEPIAIVPAGSDTYSFLDTDVVPGDEYVYGVAAQDCTPRASNVASTGTVSIPAAP
jgi:prepilin-type N-terminal cleavage/methylation domain-containing protein